MDRNKPLGGSRSSKNKMGVPHIGSELYALGTKASTSRDEKSKVMSSVKSVPDRKRDSTVPLSSVAKKPKLSGTIGSVPRLSGEGSSSSSSVLEPWEQSATDCDPSDLVISVLTAIDQQDSDTLVGLLCGASKLLASSRSKNDSILALSLIYLAKLRPIMFCNEIVTSSLVAILKRDSQHAFKGRTNPSAQVLAANLLARAYQDKKNWPEVFVRIYIDDAANERVWVDNEECAPFVQNICTAFNTRIPPRSMLQPELNSLSQTSRETLGIDDDSGDNSLHVESSLKSSDLAFDCPVQDRYLENAAAVEKYVLDIVKEQLNRRQQQDCSTRNFLKVLSTTCGLTEVRALSVTRLELWLHNGKLMKPAQELLTYICYNVTGQTIRDHEVLANLVKMRLKTKPVINIFMACLKEMINLQPNILYIALKFVAQNELSNARNPNNMGMLGNMFQIKPEQSARHLAEIYQEFMLQREDCLRTLRVFLRELVKMLRYDINLVEFCKVFLTSRTELVSQIQQFECKDRIFYSMVDLTCLCMFLTISPQVKEASNASIRAVKNSPVLLNFYAQLSQIQLDALTWMHEIVPILFKPQAQEYSQSLHKVLFLDIPEQYSKCDQWPPEPERAILLRVVSETPVREDSILRIILIGITKEIPFGVPDTIEVIEQIIRRSSALRLPDSSPIKASKLEIIDFLFSMAEYHHPENIQLPIGYEPPKLAISTLYWKAWNILLMLSAHNPSTFGSFCWEQYPMLRSLMEMCITNQFHDLKVADEELQVGALERTKILEFETHLAAATSKVVITEQNSLLLSQLMLMDPMGVARRPPIHILDQLQQLNSSHKLGHLLCRSRKPDLLLEIIQRYGTTQSMPWLSDLVQNSDGDFNHLPVQCLCEFLLSNSNNMNTENTRDAELLSYLQKLLVDNTCDKQTAYEVLEYFLRRLASTAKQSRVLAISGLKLLLSIYRKPDEEEDAYSDWLLQFLPQIPHFLHARPLIIVQLRAACQIENNPDLVMIYIRFIAENTLHDSVPDTLEHVMDMSQLIVERSTIFKHIIPVPPNSGIAIDETNNERRLQTLNCLFVMFNNYLIKLRDDKSMHEWTDYADLLMVHFDEVVHLPVHLNIIHAFVILLTHSSVSLPESIPMIDYWFPPGPNATPAYIFGTNEPVQLLPDWLKLKMIQSPVERLVEAGMRDLSPDQIVLFVQNFGTPISSVSKLLALLDHAVIEQFEAVKSAMLNKAYIGQLIEVQQKRGAKNGHITLQAMELGSQKQTLVDIPKPAISVLETINVDQFQTILPQEKLIVTRNSKEFEDVIELIFKMPALSKQNSARFRRLIQQLISKDTREAKETKRHKNSETTLHKVLTHLLRIGESSHGAFFFHSFTQKAHVCTFFRALLINTPDKIESYNFMMQVINNIIQHLVVSANLDTGSLLQILLNKRKSFVKQIVEEQPTRTEKQDFMEVLQSAKVTELEKQGRRFVNGMLRHRRRENLVEAIISVLNSTRSGDPHLKLLKIEGTPMSTELASGGIVPFDKRGILIDWLAEVDTELITVNKPLQIDLLFSSTRNEFRFYMLSLLCHQANWSTMDETLQWLLSRYVADYDCVSVLNFIDALIQNPKMWQGREKTTPKHEQIEYVLDVDMPQLKVFTEYVLNESLRELTLTHNDIDKENLNSRVSLLLKIINPNHFNIKELIDFVMAYPCPESLKMDFFQQLYVMAPPMKFISEDLVEVYGMNAQDLKGCKADKIVNYIITTIASLHTQKDYQMLSSDAELLIRKLAASHPALFLRQLAVLSSLLQGKAHMKLRLLRSEYHLSRFHQVLGVLELLQPLVFDDAYKTGLQRALDCYFTLLEHQTQIKVSGILFRIVEFLQNYINQNPSTALPFIDQYTGVLQDLLPKYPNYNRLHQLVQGLSLLRHKTTRSDVDNDDVKQEFDIDDQNSNQATETDEPVTTSAMSQMDMDSRGAASFALGGQSKQSELELNYNALAEKVQRWSTEDQILHPLQDIASMSFKRPELLASLYDRILELIFTPSSQIRAIAHILLVRYLKHKPGNKDVNKSALCAYIQCLRDPDATIAASALETMIDIVVCLQEYAPEILRTAFDLSIHSRLNASIQIKKCIQTLKLQHAC